MPDDPEIAIAVLAEGRPVEWARADLVRLRAVVNELHVGPHRAAALRRLDALLAEA